MVSSTIGIPPRDTASAASQASSGVDTRTAGIRLILLIFVQTSSLVIGSLKSITRRVGAYLVDRHGLPVSLLVFDGPHAFVLSSWRHKVCPAQSGASDRRHRVFRLARRQGCHAGLPLPVSDADGRQRSE